MRKEDEQIKQDIQASLAWDSRLDASSINIAVDNGVVTLSGEVDTFARKWAAAEDSRRVQGVRDLRNDIQVRPSWMRSDDEITQDVISAFNWDSRVDPKEITVSCENGVVTLNGAVDSFAERRAAREDAWWTSGVVDVEDNLQIKAWTPKTDYELKNDIMNTFSRDAWIDASAVQVEVENSRVHLKGHVPNYVQKTAAEEDAWWTNGVVDVVNDLEVSEEGGGSV